MFKLTSAGNYTVLYNFCSQLNCADGYLPNGGLIEDASGSLYGTTYFGGASDIYPVGGTVFKLTSAGNYTVLHNFCSEANCADGYAPYAGLIEDASGNLYGTTTSGGANNAGTVFKVDSAGNYSVLYNFCSQAGCADGSRPYAGLIRDVSGNLYGTTFTGANHTDYNRTGGGTVFKLDSAGNYSVLYNFCSQADCADGEYTYAGLVEDAAGNLYGNTYNGGNTAVAIGGGTVFKLDSAGQFTVMHIFCTQPNCTDGGNPETSLLVDSSGNLYGTTSIGGPPLYSAGIAFKVSSAGNYTDMYNFCSQANCVDGAGPYGGLIEDASGNFYGTTLGGGSPVVHPVASGVIFRLIALPDFTISVNLPTILEIPSPGEPGTTVLTLAPTGGFNQAITFSCSGLPTGASCSFSPASVTPSGGIISIFLTIATTAPSSALSRWPSFVDKQNSLLALVLLGLFVLLRRNRGKLCTAKQAAVVLALLLGLSILGLNGCGGGTGGGGAAGGGGGGGGGDATPVGTYSVTVTATASSLSQATTFTLVVE